MTGKNVLYAAVGAPVVAARRLAEAVSELRSALNKEADTLGKTANKRVALWADEGEKLVNRITDAKMVDELTSKVDFDQVSTQVSKLRDQLEDMLATWRASFRPEKLPTTKGVVSTDGVKAEPQKTVSQKAVSQKTGGKKISRKTAAAKKAPAKKAAAKSSGTPKVAGKTQSVTKASAKKAPSRKSVSKKVAARKAGSTAKSVAVAS